MRRCRLKTHFAIAADVREALRCVGIKVMSRSDVDARGAILLQLASDRLPEGCEGRNPLVAMSFLISSRGRVSVQTVYELKEAA